MLSTTDDNSGATVFQDVVMLALAGFVMLVLLLLPHLNPPTKADEEAKSAGDVTVEIRWPDASASDVDLWVRAPGDRPVGYSNQSGAVFNLLRDDLGVDTDLSGLNYEFAFSRGAPAGEYVVNLHLYRWADAAPVSVDVAVTVRARGGGAVRVFTGQVKLERAGEELTVVRFKLDEQAVLVPGSVHDLPMPLRSAQ